MFADWNDDNDVLDANETLTAQTVGASGTFSFTLSPPLGISPGTKYLRVRITEGSTAPLFNGSAALKGEVEDYPIMVGDANCYTVILANSGAFHLRAYDGASGADLGVRASGSGLSLASEIVPAPDGHLIVNNIDSGSTLKFNPYSGSFISTLIASGGPAAYASAVATDGFLYLGDYSTSVVKRNVANGAAAGTFISSASPRGILVTGDGKFIVHEYATSLKRYSAAGALEATVSSFAVSDSLSLGLGPDNNYYITTNETAKTVVRITPAGTRTTFATVAGATRLFALAWAPDGNLWACDSDGNKVYTINSSGTVIRTLTSNINSPCGLAIMPCQPSDFGDLGFNYATRMSQNGARHIVGTLRLGANLDADGDGLASPGANGDDIDHDGDDEDGVTIPTLTSGATATVVVNASTTAKVNAFFDWNNNGVFTDAGEAIAELSVVAGNNNLSVPVPAGAVTNTSLGARFRISTAGGLTSVGGAVDGEVEDYSVNVAPLIDFGDWNGAGAATTTTNSTSNSNLRLGAVVDAEISVSPNATATTDDITGSDDEDGVTMPASITQGASVTIPVSVFNNNTTNRFLQAWIDFDANGTFADPSERVYNLVTPQNASQQSIPVTFTVPLTASVGTQRGVRFRLSDNSATTPTSSGANGEIEDYVVSIACSTITVSPAQMPPAIVGRPYSLAFAANGGTAPYTFAATGTWPTGLTLSSAGVLSGTPTQVGSFSATVTATGVGGCAGSAAVTLIVDCSQVAITTTSLANGSVGSAYSQTLSALNMSGPVATNGLSAQYLLASDLTDRSSGSLNLTGSGGSFINGGLDFGTTGNYSTVSSAILNNDIHTISFYAKFTAPPNGSWLRILRYGTTSDRSPGLWRHPSTNQLHWRYDAGNTGLTEAFVYPQNDWHQVTGVKNGAT